MRRRHDPDRRGKRAWRSLAMGRIARGTTAVLWSIWSSASAALPSERASLEPYGTHAEIQQCVANLKASLGAQSVLGSRDTSAFIQDLGNLESMGLTEYNVMVGRCKDRFFRRYNRSLGKR
jgi:hypothetical protein